MNRNNVAGPELRHDRRGAIMVTAVFMAAFACGALWYVIGVGDAILYRERVQDSADAVVFASAVYHARGMNMIVTLNIVMAALLGLVVAAKLLKFLNETAMVVGCGCIPVPFIGPACATVCSVTRAARSPINTAVDRLTSLFNHVGPILSDTQDGLALAMPWLAEGKSVMVSLKYQPDVKFGATASASMIPLGTRKGLPVEDGDDAVLCGKVSGGITDMVFDALHLPEIVQGWIGGTMKGFVSSFCGGGELVDPAKQKEIEKKEEDKQVKKQCDWEQEVSHALDDPFWYKSGIVIAKARADHGEHKVDLTKLQCYPLQKDGELANLPDYNKPSTDPSYKDVPEVDLSGPGKKIEQRPPCPFNRNLCEQRARSDIQEKRKLAKGDDSGNQDIDAKARKKTRPKIVYHEAKNGNPYFQVWSLVYADDERARRPAKGVEVASWTGKKAADPSFWGRLGWAQAEFYYDTDKAWSEDVAKYDAMWNLAWRARLRRVNPTKVPDVLSNAMGDILGKIKDRIHEHVNGISNQHLADFVNVLADLGFSKASKPLEDLAHDGDEAIEKKIRDGWNKTGGIH